MSLNDCAQRSSICEGREFIARLARCKCPIENVLLKLWTKVESPVGTAADARTWG
jgi:hypothetical protein